MHRLDLSAILSRSALIGAALLTPACAMESAAPPDDHIEEEIGTAEQAAGTGQCVAYRRGVSGAVADATIWEDAYTWNTGSSPLIYTGDSSAGFRQALLHFDISNIPAGMHVDSAVLYLSELYKDDGTDIFVHRVTAPWSESTVTWQSFNGAFDPAPSASFYAWGGGVAQVHIEGLVQQWIDGAAPNHGLLLQEPTYMPSSFRSSENSTVDARPRLKVCYSPNP
ncbi:MAG TPA: DNRLRE domain-containing protein, partial [Candidatus Nanopelagicales bacterium]|nr:DNRLRE domain-containing protein [Candidatus Nanopelagicales bacterium]